MLWNGMQWAGMGLLACLFALLACFTCVLYLLTYCEREREGEREGGRPDTQDWSWESFLSGVLEREGDIQFGGNVLLVIRHFLPTSVRLGCPVRWTHSLADGGWVDT